MVKCATSICQQVAQAVKQTPKAGHLAQARRKRQNKNGVELFLAGLASGLSVMDAVVEAGVGRAYLYSLRNSDDAFRQQWDDAYELGTDLLEKAAQIRAVEGVVEDVYYKGEVVGKTRRYSDVLLIFLLKARRPTKFRETVDISNNDGSLTKAFASAVRAANGMDAR